MKLQTDKFVIQMCVKKINLFQIIVLKVGNAMCPSIWSVGVL